MSPTPTAHTLYGVLSRIQRGDVASEDPELLDKLNRAFAKHTPGLFGRVRREARGATPEQVEELVQDVLVEAWKQLPGYEPTTEFRGFLWVIARNKCRNWRRKCFDVLSEDGLVDPGSEEQSVIARLADEERDELVDRAAKNVLAPEERDLVHLRWVMEYPQAEIAEKLGWADANAVRVGLQRCKRRMTDELRRLLAERGLRDSFLGPER